MPRVGCSRRLRCKLVVLPLRNLGSQRLANYIEMLGAGGLEWKGVRGGERVRRE